MMKGKSKFVASCVVFAALAHPTVHAASGRDALEACVEALTKEISEAQGAGVNARISEDSSHGRRLDSPVVFSLDARNAFDGEIVYRADCTVDSRGQVRRLVELPMDAPDAEDRISL